MPRKPKCRFIEHEPPATYFKPRGIPMRGLDEVQLKFDELEALRLTEIEGLDQDTAAEKMGVSRQTYGRILATARRIAADAIVNGKALRIDGGNYTIR